MNGFWRTISVGGLFLIGGAALPARAIEGDWTNYVHMNGIRDLIVTEAGVWAATSGGALYYDFADAEFALWHREADGLASDSLVAVAQFEDGSLAFATERKGISQYQPDGDDPREGYWLHHTSLTWDIANDEVLFIREDPPWRFIGSRGGVMTLRDGQLRVPCEESFDPCELPSWTVAAGIYFDGYLWYGTIPGDGYVGGVGRYHYDASPRQWETVSAGLPAGSVVGEYADVVGLEVFGDELYCATTAGVYVWNGTSWDPRNTGLAHFDIVPRDLHASDDHLLAAGTGQHGGVFQWDSVDSLWVRIGTEIFLGCNCVTTGPDGGIWAGMSAEGSGEKYLKEDADGIWEYVPTSESHGEWIQYRHDSPHAVGGFAFGRMLLDEHGRLWAAMTAKNIGWWIGLLEGDHWAFFNHTNTNLLDNWTLDLHLEGDDLWIGHCCCPDPPRCPLEIWNLTDSLTTVHDSVNNVYSSLKDQRGNLWFTSWTEAGEDHAWGIYHYNPTSEIWTHYDTGTTGGDMPSNVVSAVHVDGSTLWIGYAEAGVTRCQINSQGLISPEQDWMHYTATDSPPKLAGNRISAIVGRAGEETWFGSDNGLTLREGSGSWRRFQRSEWGLPGSEITDLALTEDGAIYVAIGGEGVTRMTRNEFDGFDYQIFNYPELVNPDVRRLAVGASGLDLWIGTVRGISHFVPRISPTEVPETIQETLPIYPNPFYPNPQMTTMTPPASGYDPHDPDWVHFRELPGTVHHGVIVDVAGQLIARIATTRPEEPFWNGYDLEDRLVPPGLYIVRVATPQGWLSGRIALLHE